jgi:hypothetical protein
MPDDVELRCLEPNASARCPFQFSRSVIHARCDAFVGGERLAPNAAQG